MRVAEEDYVTTELEISEINYFIGVKKIISIPCIK
jgi:hypothetical protein